MQIIDSKLRSLHNIGGGTHFSGGTNPDSGGTFVPPFKLLKYALFPGLSMVRTFHVPTWILFFRSFFFFWFLLIWQGFRWMTTEEAPLPPLPDATLPGIQIESF